MTQKKRIFRQSLLPFPETAYKTPCLFPPAPTLKVLLKRVVFLGSLPYSRDNRDWNLETVGSNFIKAAAGKGGGGGGGGKQRLR